jgi:hypothetical protein
MHHLENHETNIKTQIKMNDIQNSFTIVYLQAQGLHAIPKMDAIVCAITSNEAKVMSNPQ